MAKHKRPRAEVRAAVAAARRDETLARISAGTYSPYTDFERGGAYLDAAAKRGINKFDQAPRHRSETTVRNKGTGVLRAAFGHNIRPV